MIGASGLEDREARIGAREAVGLVRAVARPAPLEGAGQLCGREVFLKREDLGPTGSFKWRGALCACEAMRRGGARGVATASTGNHGAAVAWAARRLGLGAHVVVPEDASQAKCGRVEEHGGTLHRAGRDLAGAAEACRELAADLGLCVLEDGGSEAQLAGVGTIASELAAERFDAVIAPLACGALAGGIARVLERSPRAAVTIGVQARAFSRLAQVLHGLPDPGLAGGRTFADGLADNRLVEPAFSACRDYLGEVLVVDDADLAAAVRELRHRCGLAVEGAAAAPLAALRRHPDRIAGERIVLIVSGGGATRG